MAHIRLNIKCPIGYPIGLLSRARIAPGGVLWVCLVWYGCVLNSCFNLLGRSDTVGILAFAVRVA